MSHNDSVITRPQPGCAGITRVYVGPVFIGRIIQAPGGVPAVYDATGRRRRGDDFSRLCTGLPPATACGCGIPAEADFYVFAVWGRDGETSYSDGYFCAAHLPAEQEAGDGLIPAGAELLSFETSELPGRPS